MVNRLELMLMLNCNGQLGQLASVTWPIAALQDEPAKSRKPFSLDCGTTSSELPQSVPPSTRTFAAPLGRTLLVVRVKFMRTYEDSPSSKKPQVLQRWD